MGGAHAVAALAYGTEAVAPRRRRSAGPGNLYVQEAKRQVSGDVGHRRLLRAQRRARASPTGPPTPARRPRPAGPGRARARDRRGARPPTTPRCWTPSPRRSPSSRPTDRRPTRRGSRSRTRRRWTRRSPSPRRSRPSTSSSSGRPPSAWRPRVRAAGCDLRGPRGRDRVRRLRRRLEPLLPTSGAARFASGLDAAACSAGAMSQVHIGDAAGALAARGRGDRARRGIAGARRVDGGARAWRIRSRDPRRRDHPHDGGDRHPPRARRSTARAPGRGPPASASSTTCSTCSPATGAWTSTSTSRGDLETGSHHTVEDTGLVLGPGARPRRSATAAGITRYGHAVVPMDEARACCALDISGPPAARVGGRRDPARRHRRVRARARRGVLPRGRRHGAADAAHRRSRPARTPTTSSRGRSRRSRAPCASRRASTRRRRASRRRRGRSTG